MQEAELGWAAYYLEVCLALEEAEAAYLRWSARAREHPGAEVRLLRLTVAETRALYCLVTQTRELVPPEVLRWHDRLAAYFEPGQPLPSSGSVWAGPGESPPPGYSHCPLRSDWEKGVRTLEAWDEHTRRVARKRRRWSS